MPILLSDGENLYLTPYNFRTVIQTIGTNPMAEEQEIFLTIKNVPVHAACLNRGTTPRQIQPSIGPKSLTRPGTTPRRIKPGKKKCC